MKWQELLGPPVGRHLDELPGANGESMGGSLPFSATDRCAILMTSGYHVYAKKAAPWCCLTPKADRQKQRISLL
jgi:hypothetical protein